MSDRPSRVFTIPAGVPFVDALARGLLARWGDDPLALARVTLLLPTRRACRSLREAFLEVGGGRALLLPSLKPLGDLDSDEGLTGADDAVLPPAMSGLRRQLLLARLIMQKERGDLETGTAGETEDQAARLAAELARLLDQVETEGLSFDGLAALAPEAYADHWQEILRFLSIVTQHWPAIQAEAGALGPAERRRLLLERQAAAWRQAPPADPVIVAGSTGSIPAAAGLIATVAGLPAGEVVLPGLDRASEAAAWSAIADDPSHPQFGLALLLDRLGLQPAAVADWPWAAASAAAAARAKVLSWALRPASATADWAAAGASLSGDEVAMGLADLRRIDCAGPGEEASVVALLLRQALEDPATTAALVTPDRGLARRVAAELGRWDIEVDDSAGQPLADTPPGSLLRLSAEMIDGKLGPIGLLAALKHPLAAGGLKPAEFRRRVRALELAVLHGPRPGPGFEGLDAALRADHRAQPLRSWLRDLARMAAPFEKALTARRPRLGRLVTAHLRFAEALAASDAAPGAERLWAQEAGEAAARFMAELADSAGADLAFGGARYPALLSTLMAGQVVRPRQPRHPRLAILGPLEARLQGHDLVILGGLNEGSWPAQVDPGPWMSRPMRRDFGLPAPERRIGLAAHDFAQLCSTRRVVLTRARRAEGAPTVPSRWLLRLDALLQALGHPGELARSADQVRSWAAGLDRAAQVQPVAAPAPRPPLAVRPRSLSVTQIETWMRDPYALYARHVLGLKRLDPIDADPGAAERGTLIHEALEAYVKDHPEAPPADALAALLAEGERRFGWVRARPGLWAFWWPRFERIARWFVEADGAARAEGRRPLPELKGGLELSAPGGPFRLTAKADRIDRLADGRLAILDYKTGQPPKREEVELGFAPQLPLEAAIALAGGFAGLAGAEVAELVYWRLSGGTPPGEIVPIKAEPSELAAEARDGLAELVARFDQEETPYRSLPRPAWAPRYSDYEHLARVKEWSAGGPGRESEG